MRDLIPGTDPDQAMLDFLQRKFSTWKRALGEVPQMDLQEAVRRLADLVLDGCGQRPGVGSRELEALQYAAAAVALSNQQIDRSQVVVLTIGEAEELARRTGDGMLRERCRTTRALAEVGKGLHTAKWTTPTGEAPALGGSKGRALGNEARNRIEGPKDNDDERG